MSLQLQSASLLFFFFIKTASKKKTSSIILFFRIQPNRNMLNANEQFDFSALAPAFILPSGCSWLRGGPGAL